MFTSKHNAWSDSKVSNRQTVITDDSEESFHVAFRIPRPLSHILITSKLWDYSVLNIKGVFAWGEPIYWNSQVLGIQDTWCFGIWVWIAAGRVSYDD